MDLYQEEILEHYRHPHNQGHIENATVEQKERNSSCGDELNFTFLIDDGVVKDVKFEGAGCAISQASASMLTDEVIGMPVEEVRALTRDDIVDLLGIELGPTRLKCALLSLQGTHNALGKLD